MGLRMWGTQIVVAGARAVMRLCGVLALLASLTAALPAAAASASPWRVQQTPNQSVPNGALLSASCTSVTACTAVGYHTNDAGAMVGLAEAWNGKNWRTQVTPTHRDLNGSALTLAEAWNGTVWSIQPTPNPVGALGGFLDDVSCTSASTCTAVGDYTNSTSQLTLAEVWNGTAWTIQDTPNPVGATASELRGISCISASACTAAGDYSGSRGTPLTLAESTF